MSHMHLASRICLIAHIPLNANTRNDLPVKRLSGPICFLSVCQCMWVTFITMNALPMHPNTRLWYVGTCCNVLQYGYVTLVRWDAIHNEW
uniref:Uncharacterized protein n=1 Tax=Pyxicephalus adspersus TaxID=30357 RepID=A0AAV2ZRM2_PYXAD|nr:TPA: hypothetical protein GDO54_015147 [Pyxicephalus adspersus]